LLIDGATDANRLFLEKLSDDAQKNLEAERDSLFGFEPPIARDARIRYAWVREVLAEVQSSVPRFYSWRAKLGTTILFLAHAHHGFSQ
jgi:hypothetical protein